MTTLPSEEKKNNWRINVRIGNERMALRIPRDPIVEKRLRDGATTAGSLVSQYSSAYPDASDVQILSYVALHLANRLEQLTHEEKASNTDTRLQEVIELLDRIDDGDA